MISTRNRLVKSNYCFKFYSNFKDFLNNFKITYWNMSFRIVKNVGNLFGGIQFRVAGRDILWKIMKIFF